MCGSVVATIDEDVGLFEMVVAEIVLCARVVVLGVASDVSVVVAMIDVVVADAEAGKDAIDPVLTRFVYARFLNVSCGPQDQKY